jgi:hypothetical protein
MLVDGAHLALIVATAVVIPLFAFTVVRRFLDRGRNCRWECLQDALAFHKKLLAYSSETSTTAQVLQTAAEFENYVAGRTLAVQSRHGGV